METKNNFSLHRKPHRIITPPERKTLPSPPASGERDQAPAASTVTPISTTTTTSFSPSFSSSTADELPQSLLNLKRRLEGTQHHSSLATVKLTNKDYERCYDKILATFRRFDYLSQKELLIIRMPSVAHDNFIWSLGIAIHEKLRDLGRQNEQVLSFTNRISNMASGKRSLRENGIKIKERMPDAQFAYKGAKCPGVVIEVALTQNGKRLAKIAQEYIYYSNAAIQVVICVNLNSGKDSTISVWKPGRATIPDTDEVELVYDEVVKREAFRIADGSPVNKGALTLHLHDFATEKFRQGIPNLSFSIPYSDMAKMLNDAEEYDHDLNAESEEEQTTSWGKKRPPASDSGAEEMTEQDKERLEDEATAAMDKLDARDETYEGDAKGKKEERPAKKRAQSARNCASS
ncbi:hypothetical protein FLAG1_12172 [Fusarium langsethiae]|uniref:Uncharacterized protein n=1 Tax=Fusarium langsethiae TaxID=179993 RepID=A0A0M9ELI0_FUSLA|nr:hypothetical protein FLAG1_12172 [Fusarium langsethiae]GKU12989.1 unnamed protein product [Fusarium langsethiae]